MKNGMKRSTEAIQRDRELRTAVNPPSLAEPQPIWMAVLAATQCRVAGEGTEEEEQVIQWERVAGRAVYTNTSGALQWIQPLGVRLLSGYTLAICWEPGETGYNMETYRHSHLCVA